MAETHLEILPAAFMHLEPFVTDWALPTQRQRELKRLSSTSAELRQFYDLMMDSIRPILEEVDKFEIGALPGPQARLFDLALSLAEIAPNIELYKGDIRVTQNFDERRFVARHGSHPTHQGPHEH